MSEQSLVEKLEEINSRAAFNRWAGLRVTAAEPGLVELTLAWREDFGQYNGFLHAGMIGALIDTSCGFAAVTTNEWVMASHFSVNCLAPARGETFVARARILKPGRKQIFAAAELFAVSEGRSTLAATGQTLLVPTQDRAAPQA
ncbi:MAG: PaaI family thioesterase [Phenylobacterium sp.]|uniref:PaaI family thioesterase n=1 Tax=Phenylobacterium sp. TaxID=1871053 RepID=UPI002736288E|nr:PaaI family thioesterase [Phenylobacterium sp.]MDP3175880.1 PaaI family thioesterase [Phenylobacterium sp.]